MKAIEFTHTNLINIAHKWVLKYASCGVAFRDIKHIGTQEIVDVLGLGSGEHSVLIEVKVSRSDFLADKKKPFRQNPEFGMGMYRFYFCPKDLIKLNEVPEKWGLLYVDELGKIEVIFNPMKQGRWGELESKFKWRFEKRNVDGERSIMYSILRRLQLNKQLTDF